MKQDVPRWLHELALALDRASSEVDAPGGDIHWLLLRCRDTLQMDGNLRAQSLEDLVQSLARMLRGYPTGVPESLLHAAMAAPGRAFPFALLRTEALALGLPGAPRWDSVTITGPLEDFPARQTHLASTDLVAADAFAERFDQLLSLGFPWINLSAVGLLRGALLVTVETPASTRADIEFTSVNASGPPAWVQKLTDWRIDHHFLIEDSQ
ncbi:MAG: hypothetical protein ABJE95_02505 [Byssovorax sp.]